MKPVSIDSLAERLKREDKLFVEFLRVDSMSLEIYRLAPGQSDPQDPHTEDEVYYVVSGIASIRVGDETYEVEAGDVVHVERAVEHYFFDVKETLVAFVVFVPPYGSLAED